MDLDRYSAEAARHSAEIFEELRQCDIAALADACRHLGRDTVAALVRDSDTEFLRYVRANPSQRKRLLGKVERRMQPIYLLSALYVARCAQAMLDALCSRAVMAGPPYREVTGRAAEAAFRLQDEWPTLWPFDDDSDPFDET